MKYVDLVQGSPEWLAHRAVHHNASDAPAMLGISTKKTRSQLLRERFTGLGKEFTDFVQEHVLDPGHQFEALARPLAETIIGESLYPVVGTLGKLSASFDGLTLDESTDFEHKRLNEELRACLPAGDGSAIDGGVQLPKSYRAQMEQQLHVSGASRALFMASDWTNEGKLIEERHCWYYPDEELRAEILNGWAQFERDLAAYQLPPVEAATPAGRAPNTLPALRIEVTGQVTASNLAEFKTTALTAIRSVRRELTTDQDFADAEASVKWCGEVETRLAAAKQHALSQTASIDALFSTIDDISDEARRVRLELEKLVKGRKEAIKGEIVAAGRKAYEAHELMLQREAGGWIALSQPDFAAAIKSLRTVDSIRNAVDTLLAKAKITADESARRIREALRIMAEDGAGFEFLLSDRLALIGKAPDDLRLLVKSRITEHQAAEQRRVDDERARIRAEEQAKAERQQRETQAAEDALVLSIERLSRRIEADTVAYIEKASTAYESTGTDWTSDPRPRVREAFLAGRAYLADRLAAAKEREAEAQLRREEAETRARVIATASAPAPAPSAAGIIEQGESPAGQALAAQAAARPENWPFPQPAAAPAEPATLNLGAICARLGYIVSAKFLEEVLGIAPASIEKSAKLYRESQFVEICRAINGHNSRLAARDWRVAVAA